jgi:DNA-binding NarL/FixJ family response regulator
MTPPYNRIKVLTIDDHRLVCDGIAFAISMQPYMLVVAQGTNGEEAIQLCREHRPDVTFMDLQMPKMNGIEAIELIQAEHPAAKIIVLTTYSGDAQASRALRLGASGYLLNSMLRTELISTIRDVHAGKRRVQAEVAAGLADHVASDSLTPRENLDISEDAVKGHMKNILSKLHANDRTHAVIIALKRGFLDG